MADDYISEAKKNRPMVVLKIIIVILGFGAIVWLTFSNRPSPLHVKTNNKIVYPERVNLMALNTVSIFFFLMSIMEFNLHYASSPLGIDYDKISSNDCQREIAFGFWILMVIVSLLVAYNVGIIYQILEEPTLSREEGDSVEAVRRGNRAQINRHIQDSQGNIDHNLTNFARVVRTSIPLFFREKFVCIGLAVISATIYLCFVIFSYYTNATPMKACVGNTSGIDNIYLPPPSTASPNCLYPNESDAVKTCDLPCPAGQTAVCKSSEKDDQGCWHCNACACE